MNSPLKTSSERRTRSHSQLNDYLHCGHGFYLKRMLKVPEAGSVWLHGGRAFHETTEAFDRAVYAAGLGAGSASLQVMLRENDPLLDPEPWQNMFEDVFTASIDTARENDPDGVFRTAGRKTKDKPNGEDETWWREAGREMVGRYINWRTSVGDVLALATVESGPGIEIEVTAPVGGVPMVGYVDRLFRDQNDAHLVVDLKTGPRTPASPMQLALYSVQLEAQLGVPVTWGAWYDARKGTLSDPIDLSTFTEQKLGRVYRGLDRGISQGVFLPNIDSHCRACGVRSACVYQGGIEPASALTGRNN